MNSIDKKVNSFYESYPYPSLAAFKSKYKLTKHANKVLKSINLTINDFKKRQTILDVGCGTGEITCSIASNKKVKVIGIDLSNASLKKAKALAKKFKLKNIVFKKKNLFELNEGKFNYVFSFGVIHHTSKPKEAFKILASHLKKNGLISIGLYSKYGRLMHRLNRLIIRIFAGDNFEKRLRLAIKLFGKGNENELQLTYLADKYANPLEKYISLQEVLQWFKENNIEFIGSQPKIKGNLKRINLILNQLKWLFNKNSFFIISGKKIN